VTFYSDFFEALIVCKKHGDAFVTAFKFINIAWLITTYSLRNETLSGDLSLRGEYKQGIPIIDYQHPPLKKNPLLSISAVV